MGTATKRLKICSKGHQFYKSSDCDSCPICENLLPPNQGFLSLVSAPARRALASKQIDSLSKLATFRKNEIAVLHGMGPNAIAKLENALKTEGLSFMPTSKPSDKEQVDAHLAKLDLPIREIIAQLRKLFLAIDPLVGEHIKWNSISFFYTGEMKPFDPKTFQRDMVVCNVHRGQILLVFPTGAKVKDNLDGKNYPDGRKIISIADLDDLDSKKQAIREIALQWLTMVV